MNLHPLGLEGGVLTTEYRKSSRVILNSHNSHEDKCSNTHFIYEGIGCYGLIVQKLDLNELRSDSGACVCSSEPGCVIVANSYSLSKPSSRDHIPEDSLTSSLHLGLMSHLCASFNFHGGFIWICIPAPYILWGTEYIVKLQKERDEGQGEGKEREK